MYRMSETKLTHYIVLYIFFGKDAVKKEQTQIFCLSLLTILILFISVHSVAHAKLVCDIAALTELRAEFLSDVCHVYL